jgi:deoxyribodipyrimidine photo-lyase
MKNGLVWFKSNDLRLLDNRPLFHAHEKCEHVDHIYIFDPSEFQIVDHDNEINFKTSKCAVRRFKFICECIQDLNDNLIQKNSKLNLFIGEPKNIIPYFINLCGIDDIFYHLDVTSNELATTNEVQNMVQDIGVSCHTYFGGGTLFEPTQLPFKIKDLEYFTAFRKVIENNNLFEKLEASLPVPLVFKPFYFDHEKHALKDYFSFHENNTLNKQRSPFDDTVLKLWENIQLKNNRFINISNEEINIKTDLRTSFPFQGGETSGLKRVEDYINNGFLLTYKQTRNNLIGVDYSTKFSPFLSTGCITSKYIYEKIKEFEYSSFLKDQPQPQSATTKTIEKNESLHLIIFELLWRDYMKLYALKASNKLFHRGGYQQKYNKTWSKNISKLNAWKNGMTGYPFIDANMRELKYTGYMSNRGRQVVASFFVRDMNMDWRLGAEYFEEMLLDNDVCSNFGFLVYYTVYLYHLTI